ncbi:retrovirus-related pol polyprotein from transposon TNT 1-94 [Tanacetum coccineum]
MSTPVSTSSTDSQMHNNIMAAGSKDRPPMLGPGRYSQWRSRFLRYIDTKNNGEGLKKCILNGPYVPTSVLIQAVPEAEGRPAVQQHTAIETVLNMTPENKEHFQSEKEAIFLLLTGIGDEIYSTVDACNTANEMWIAIERLQQGESLNVQDVKTNLFWEFGKFTSRDGESMESYYSRFYKLMNELTRNNLQVTTMQVNVQFLQQLQPEWSRFVTIVKQAEKIDTVSYHRLFDILKQFQLEVNDIRSERIAKSANPLALIAAAQPYSDNYYQAPKPQRSNEHHFHKTKCINQHKGKDVANRLHLNPEVFSEKTSDLNKHIGTKEMQKNFGTPCHNNFKKIYKPTNNNLRTSSNSMNKTEDTTPRYNNDNQSKQFGNQRTMTIAGARETVGSQVVQQTRIQCFNCKGYGHYAKECRKPKRVKDYAYHKKKMMMCNRSLNKCSTASEQADWLEDTDEEIDEQELEAHYSYMAKIQEVSPEESSSTGQPHLEQKDDSNVTPDSSNICTNDNQVDQNAAECVDERAALANLIANLTLDMEENKTILKQLKKANASLTQELEKCKTNLDKTNSTLGEAISCWDSCLISLQNKQNEFEKYKAFNDWIIDYEILQTKLNETLGLLALKDIEIKEGLKTKAYEISVLNQKHDELVKKSLLTKSQLEGYLKENTKVISDLKVKEDKDIDKMIEMDKQLKFLNEIVYTRNQSIQTIHMLAPKCSTYNGRPTFANPRYLKKAQSEKPCLYEIPFDTSDPANRFAPEREETTTLDNESRSKLNKDYVKPYDYTKQNSLYEIFKGPSLEYLYQLERGKEVRKTMWRKPFVRTKPNIAKNVAFLPVSKSISKNFEYVKSLEKEIDELESEKADFSNMYDLLLEECVSKDVICSYLHSLSELNAHTELQCMYLHKVKECECLAQKLSKQTESVNNEVHNKLLKSFAKLEKHSISLELSLQHCKEQMKNNPVCKENASNVFRKEREQYHEIQDLKAQMQDKNMVINELKKLILSVNKTNVSDGLFKQVTQQNLPQNRKQAEIHSNVLKPGMYRIATTTTQNREPQLPHASRNTNPHVSKSSGVNHTTSVSRPQLKCYQVKDKAVPNNSQVKFKKKEVEDHHRISNISKKTKSITACNDSSNSRTSNVNAVCAECGKCVFNSNHDACVSRYLKDVNARTKKPKVVPISASKPKRKANKSVATPHKKIVASDTTIQKSKSYHKELYENTNQEWKWWIAKRCPSGYKWTQKPLRTKKIWMPKIRKEDVSTSISPTIDIVSRITNIVQLILFIVDSGCTKHMTGNLKLLCNFVEKFLGTVRFGNDQFAPILGYGDLNQGNVMIKRVYYVEGLNHNLFSVNSVMRIWRLLSGNLLVFVRELQGKMIYVTGSFLRTKGVQIMTTSDPVPPRQNVVPTAEKTDSSQQGLEFLFSPLLEEYYNPTHGLAEENNNDQAEMPSVHQFKQDDSLPTDLEMCMFALTVSIVEPKNIKEAMVDSAWIEAMQDELHQFDRLKIHQSPRGTSGGIPFHGDMLVSMDVKETKLHCNVFSRGQVENGIIELYFVRTEYQLADMFTKALPEDRFKYLVRRIGMRCLSPAELEVLTNETA